MTALVRKLCLSAAVLAAIGAAACATTAGAAAMQRVAARAAVAASELAPDGDVETDPSVAWTGNGPCSFAWASDRVHGGSGALRIVSGTSELCRWLTPTSGPAAIGVTPGASYDLSAWLLADRLSAGVTLSANFWTAAGAYIPSTVDAPSTGTPLVWSRQGTRVTAPAGAAVLRVEVRLVGAGTLWADDISVQAAASPAPPPPVAILGLAPTDVADGGSALLTWRHDDIGSYSVRVGGTSCADGLVIDSGTTTTAPETRTSTVGAGALAVGPNTVRVCVTNANGTGEAATTLVRVAPPQPGGTLAGTVAAGAGDGHTCAVDSAGTVRCWGDDTWGQLGDGRPASHQVQPVDAVGLPTGAVAVDGGWVSTCALGGDARVRCWGGNGWGNLGDGSTADSFAPVEVQGLRDVVAITVGTFHACAITRAGALWCWGLNNGGELGDGTTVDRSVPVPVQGLESGVVAVSAGQGHTCAVTAAGAVLCWGVGSRGQLGDGRGAASPVPVQVQGLGPGSGATEVGAAAFHSCAIANGRVLCWGENDRVQLGDGSTEERTAPVPVRNDAGVASITGAHGLAVGGFGACVIADGAVRCWGAGLDGQLGAGASFDSAGPEAVVGLAGRAVSLAAGGAHTCAVLEGGGIECWGWNGYGQLGDGTTTSRNAAVPVVAPGATGPASLAPDPGFEADPAAGWYTAGSGSFDWTAAAAHSPSHAVRIVSAQPAGEMARWMTRIPAIPVTPGRGYDVGAWLSGEALAGGLQLVVTFWGPGETAIPGSAYHAEPLLGSVPWTKTALHAVAPPGAVSLRVELRLLGPGTLVADDVEVVAR